PLATIISALFLGFVFAAGDIIKVTLRLPFQITDVISGLILFFLICSEPLITYRLRYQKQAEASSHEALTSPQTAMTSATPTSTQPVRSEHGT
ncbi:MAG: hypothetical protein AAF708_13070, partial [Deinococcota bacterium]